MVSPRIREGSQPGPRRRRLALWAALGVGGLLPNVGCQVEYAGMTLPSSKYMYDDVQYFPPGPEMPWANTVAATQRAYMRSQGMDVPEVGATGPIGTVPPAQGMLAPSQNVPNMPTNVNVQQNLRDQPNVEVPPPPAPGNPEAQPAAPDNPDPNLAVPPPPMPGEGAVGTP